MPLQLILLLGVLSWSQFDGAALAVGEDCNENGISDDIDLLPESFGFSQYIAQQAESGVINLKSKDYQGNPIDLNGDERTDLVVINRESDSVSIHLNAGEGRFEHAFTYPVGEFPQTLAVADFDRDGRLDIAVACFWGRRVSVLYGMGKGRFQAAVDHPVGFKARAIVAGDFNNDAFPDLAVTRWDGDRDLLILTNDQRGSFSGRDFRINNVSGSRVDITTGDMDGDGSLDLVVLLTNRRPSLIVIMPGQGDGTFPFRFVYPLGFPWWDMAATGVVLADLDGDGDLDIAVSNWWYRITGWGDVRLLENLGDFNFGEPIISPPLSPNIEGIIAEDVDLDGDIDLCLVSGSGSFSHTLVWLNEGYMNFREPHRFSVDDHARAIASGDFDGDGRIDLVTANVDVDDNISVLLGTTDGPAFDHDCNLNDIPDGCDIAEGRSEDCNDNGFPDECEPDCNHNGVPDDCDIARRDSPDGNRNGIPDECEDCFGDFNRNGERDEIDLLVLQGVFGCRVGDGNWPCDEADIDGDGQVNPLDLGLLQALMGPCPDGEEP